MPASESLESHGIDSRDGALETSDDCQRTGQGALPFTEASIQELGGDDERKHHQACQEQICLDDRRLGRDACRARNVGGDPRDKRARVATATARPAAT
jgi:hypothetical protein